MNNEPPNGLEADKFQLVSNTGREPSKGQYSDMNVWIKTVSEHQSYGRTALLFYQDEKR